MMNLKSKVVVLGVILLAFACNKSNVENNTATEQTADPNKKYAKIVFEENAFEFGKINQGEIVKHTFNFKNESDEALIISSAQASCGCTVPSFPKDPIGPGESGKIDVQFNSTGKSGAQNKSITITANTFPNITTLLLKGEVILADTTKK